MNNIFPEFKHQVSQSEKETLLGQKGAVLWLLGYSGSGKSTIANALERRLHDEGKYVIMLDGDNLRSGLNSNLGFSDEDREENIRRTSEFAKLIARSGVIVLVSLITPQEKFRLQVREIIPADQYSEIYVKTSFEECMKRDVKGLYAKQAAGEIKNFTGKSSNFEEPQNSDLIIETENVTVERCLDQLYEFYQINHN
jgi:adenylylsulfate kinase